MDVRLVGVDLQRVVEVDVRRVVDDHLVHLLVDVVPGVEVGDRAPLVEQLFDAKVGFVELCDEQAASHDSPLES